MAALGDLLFYRRDQVDLDLVLRHQVDQLRGKVDALPEKIFGEKTDQEIAAEVAAKAVVAPLVADFANAVANVQEVQVEVRDHFEGMVRVAGLRATEAVPFTGDPDLWLLKTNPWGTNPPRGEVRGGKVIIGIEVAASQADDASRYIAEAIASIPEYLDRQKAQIHTHNASLAAKALPWVQQRRARVGQASDLLKKLQG